MSKKIIIANWKANPATLRAAQALVRDYRTHRPALAGVRLVVCPPHVFAAPLAESIAAIGELGVQNIAAVPGGTHTGEVTASMCESIGARICILGHSERRAMGETDDIINHKVLQALRGGLHPVLAVGEAEKHDDVHRILETQIRSALRGVSAARAQRMMIAYEPRWAISKGVRDTQGSADTPEHAIEKMIYIRRVIAKLSSASRAHAMPILYGGSLRAANSGAFLKQGYGFDGALVGGASLDARELVRLIAASSA